MRHAEEISFNQAGEPLLWEEDSTGATAEGCATQAGSEGTLLGPRALMLAVLEDAIHCAGIWAFDRRPESRRRRHQARAWIHSGDEDWLFSFEGICAALSIDAGRLRRRVLSESSVLQPGRRRRIHGLPRPPKRLNTSQRTGS